MLKRFMSVLLALTVVIGIMPMTAMAEVDGTIIKDVAVFEDMPENWSTEALEAAVANGLLKGSDGMINPDDELTRAEMATIVNRSFNASEEADLDEFKDVSADAWYYDEMAKAVAMETFQGFDNLLEPENPISRQEAFAVIARAFKIEKTGKSPKGYADLSDLAIWAREEVFGLVEAGYVKGSDDKLNPNATITRAEFAQVMHNLVKEYITTPGVKESVAKGNVMVNIPGVILKGVTVDGDLIIGDGVGSGDVILDDVDVKGRMVVRGGGENSIIIKGDSKVANLVVARVGGAVRVRVEGNAAIKNIDVLSQKTNIEVGKDAQVENIVVEASDATVSGEGKVENVEVKANSNNAAIKTPNTKVAVAKGVKGTTGTGGAAIEAETTVNNSKDVDKAPTKVETQKPEADKPATGGGGGGGTTTTAAERLRNRVASKVKDAVEAKKNQEGMNFTYGGKVITVTANSLNSLLNLSNTGVMEELADIYEIVGYEGKSFLDDQGNRKSNAEIKNIIEEDLEEALNGKTSIKAELSLKDGNTTTTDTYTFTFKFE